MARRKLILARNSASSDSALSLEAEFRARDLFLARIGATPKFFIPISAFNGENLIAPSDKMPFEVTPVFFRLTRYTPPVSAVATPAAGAADATAPAVDTQQSAAPAQASASQPSPQ